MDTQTVKTVKTVEKLEMTKLDVIKRDAKLARDIANKAKIDAEEKDKKAKALEAMIPAPKQATLQECLALQNKSREANIAKEKEISEKVAKAIANM